MLVRFHAADKDIPKTGQFRKERGLIDSQFHMAGQASQSWQKMKEEQKDILHGGRQECVCRGTPLYQTIRSRETYYHESSMGKTHPHDSVTSHWVPPATRGNYGSTIQDEIWVGTYPNHVRCFIVAMRTSEFSVRE